jgi:FAD/FMN-containing dehydrogenase
MHRRKFIKTAIAIPSAAVGCSSPGSFRRVRPGDPLWPSEASWNKLNQGVDGNLLKLHSPFVVCKNSLQTDDCNKLFKSLKNPYAIGDNPALTQTLGWHNAWTSEASIYAVAAKKTAHVVAAVNFAREHNLRLVVKGGGHSYQGTSNSKDSLLIWTRDMNDTIIHDAFVGKNCEGKQEPQPAVSISAGAIWMHVNNAVTTKAGWYVQGGGCATVGVAGLIQSGGFGSLSKTYGLAAASLLEAEVVTATGSVLIANACTYQDLFWALKGGGGGSLGVVTRLTLKLHHLPRHVGAVFGRIKAASEKDYQTLITYLVDFYKNRLFNSNWGEQIRFYPDNSVAINMMFANFSEEDVKTTWQPLLDMISENKSRYSWEMPFAVHELPAQSLWDVSFFKKNAPQLIGVDDRTGAPENNIFWIGDGEESGQFLYGYHSAWLSQSLLNDVTQLSNALYNASRFWTVSLHFNKGLAGASGNNREAAKNTAMNPQVVDAFALAIIAGGSQPVYPNVSGHQPDYKTAQETSDRINKAMNELLKIAPNAGSYVSESNFFQKDWQHAFWGSNYQRLMAVKKEYDPNGLFFVHHGVGSEEWSNDGFNKK